ncbi:MAG: hypothetical protein LPK58_02525 [Gammaproteobacteria bacterium]|nr:hypothetical protein [Gammaproteobacteria bacterium]MDX5374592.1 hypothetical protein [Gammaproteobacteria bacterium]
MLNHLITPSQADGQTPRLHQPMAVIKGLIALMFSTLFLTLSVSLGILAIVQFTQAFGSEGALISGLVKSINTAVISLATFELGIGIGKEYSIDEEGGDIFPAVRRSITRFVAVVCIALVLEGLIMVIKYSQLDMAGNLYYPVAIVVSASMLLLALGGFLRLTQAERRPAA